MLAYYTANTAKDGRLRKVKVMLTGKIDWIFIISCAAHHLLRLPKLLAIQI